LRANRYTIWIRLVASTPRPRSASRCIALSVALCLIVGCSVFPDVPPVKSDALSSEDADSSHDATPPDAAEEDVLEADVSVDAHDAADAEASPDAADSEDSHDALAENDAPDELDAADGSEALDAVDSSDALDGDANLDDAAHCSNSVTDGDETDLNCGGLVCDKCKKHNHCLVDTDCTNYCNQTNHECT
jgi:hypothetical protein